jgi:hypothetical protein
MACNGEKPPDRVKIIPAFIPWIAYLPAAEKGAGTTTYSAKERYAISETGTGFAGAKLSEILPAARVARFVRMTNEARARSQSGFNALPHAAFGGSHYSLDETGAMNGVFKAGCAIGARTHITDKMRVNLSNVDRDAHEATGQPGRLGRWECHV